MGTQKQADTLVRLASKIENQQGRPSLTSSQEAQLRRDVLAMSLADVRAMFDKANALLGFDRAKSPATVEQLGVIGRLERDVLGVRRTTFLDALTFEQAHLLIDELGAARAAKHAAGSRDLAV